MFRALAMTAFAASCLALGAESMYAQGRGGGWHRGLSAAAGAASGSAASQAGAGLARAHGNGNWTAKTGSAVGGFQRAQGALNRSVSPAPGNPLSNQDRIYQHRLGQAEHLRSVAQKNGNEALLETADRMEANAARNYQRQTGITLPTTPSTTDPAAGESTAPAEITAAPAQSPTTPKRGFWFRSR